MRKLLASSKVLVLFDQAIVSGSNFLMGVLIARSCGLEGFGLYSLIFLFYQLLASFQDSFIISPMLVFLPKSHRIRKEKLLFFYGCNLFVFIVVCLVITLSLKLLHLDLGFEISKWGKGAFFYVFLLIIYEFFRKILFCYSSIKKILFADSFFYLGRVGILFYSLNREEYGLEFILYGASGLLVLINIYSISKFKFIRLRKRVLRIIAKKTYLFSRWLVLTNVLVWFSSNFLILSSASILGLEQLGALRSIQNLLAPLHILYLGIDNYYTPIFSKFVLEGNYRAIKKEIFQVAALSLIFFIIISILYWMYGGQALYLIYSKDFSQYRNLFFYFMFFYFLVFLSTITRVILKSLEKSSTIFISYCFSTIFSVSSSYYLINSYGLVGVLFGLIINQFIFLLINVIPVKNVLFSKVRQ